VLISRVGTSGGLAECVLDWFKRTTSTSEREDGDKKMPEFVFMENWLGKLHPDPDNVKQVYIKQRLPYEELLRFKAVVFFPYDTSLMLFWEFFSANIPIFVPHRKGALAGWMWGQHTRFDLLDTHFNSNPDELPPEQRVPGFRPCSVVERRGKTSIRVVAGRARAIKKSEELRVVDLEEEKGIFFEPTFIHCLRRCEASENWCDAFSYSYSNSSSEIVKTGTTNCLLYRKKEERRRISSAFSEEDEEKIHISSSSDPESESESVVVWIKNEEEGEGSPLKLSSFSSPLLPAQESSNPEIRPDPTFNTFSRLRPAEMSYWSTYADWSFYPHLIHFHSLQHLVKLLATTDLHQVASDMKVFNDRAIVHSAQRWARLFEWGDTA